jgi:L-rhamnose isomerase
MARGIEQAYEHARERYQELGVDTDAAIKRLGALSVSMHCWQGDDVGGFEHAAGPAGGIMATGNYPGKARSGDELRADLSKAMSLIPGSHRLNLHAIYAETEGERVERNRLEPRHFSSWIEWASQKGIGLDFNATFFAHPLADTGFTLSNRDESIRSFWVEHAIACRRITAAMSEQLKTPSVHNIWIPDGHKDVPADRTTPRQILQRSLDEIFAVEISPSLCRDAVESKLFGIGSESYVVGSHEFYMGYAVRNAIELCLDAGHFHPTETIADKISSVLLYLPRVLLHVSRGVRWDSDHVVMLTDDMYAIATELVRGNYLDRVDIATDFFDASINRIAAWVIGIRSLQKALLVALLEPTQTLQGFERSYDYSSRLAMMEELKSMPWGAVWDYFCHKHNVPTGMRWMDEVRSYEQSTLSKRG